MQRGFVDVGMCWCLIMTHPYLMDDKSLKCFGVKRPKKVKRKHKYELKDRNYAIFLERLDNKTEFVDIAKKFHLTLGRVHGIFKTIRRDYRHYYGIEEIKEETY